MMKAYSLLVLGALSIGSCQQKPDPFSATPPAQTKIPKPAEAADPAEEFGTAPPKSGPVTTAEAALYAVSYYQMEMTEGGQYEFDSARVQEAAAHWQVVLPSLPGDGRVPNKAVFQVDKATGDVQVRFVK
ncbi:hypothetical protein [Hymenobacter metallicola]|uniref:Uncharacterized protein n=1 Tax=Hymenobacter metallicola TaxID=2563114 RepID=A0A4Z0Q2L0_9BACT|nr:hypothetical protein [Hymenobacter metallicola]TGE23331.1 hypothetical protein E5K02_19240 [Hymenobacter metallicola]